MTTDRAPARRGLWIGLWLALGACAALALPPAQAQTTAAPAQSDQQLAQGARAALDAMLAAYAGGQSAQAESLLDDAMIGRQAIADQMRVSLNQHLQVQVNLRDTDWAVNAGVVQISTNWAMRFLQQPGLAPGLRSGHAVFMWQLGRAGWRLIGLRGDSPFAP